MFQTVHADRRRSARQADAALLFAHHVDLLAGHGSAVSFRHTGKPVVYFFFAPNSFFIVSLLSFLFSLYTTFRNPRKKVSNSSRCGDEPLQQQRQKKPDAEKRDPRVARAGDRQQIHQRNACQEARDGETYVGAVSAHAATHCP